MSKAQRESAKRDFESLLDQVENVSGVSVLAAQVNATNIDMLRDMSDWFRSKVGSGVIVLGAVFDGKPNLLAAVTPDLVERGLDAGKIVRSAAQIIGGGGGGKPTLAQAGGKDASRLGEALASVKSNVADSVR